MEEARHHGFVQNDASPTTSLFLQMSGGTLKHRLRLRDPISEPDYPAQRCRAHHTHSPPRPGLQDWQLGTM
eukprot:7582506-Lingulodinium_polyedra.AAC.1